MSEKLTLVQGVNRALAHELEHDPDVMVLGEDVGLDGGVFRATEGLQQRFGRDRVVDTPLAESAIVGTSIGLALAGFKPVAEIQFSGFMLPAFDQIVSHAARIRNRTRGSFHCQLVVRMPYGAGIRALEHHSESPEAFFAHVPGLKCVIPSTPADAKGLLMAAIRDPDPVIFLEPKRIYRAFKEEVPEGEHVVELGKAAVRREGEDVSLVAWGAMTRVAMEAADALAEKGVSAELLDLRTVSPYDDKALVDSVKKTGRCVIVQEAPRSGGFAAELASCLVENCLESLLAPVERVTGFDVIPPLAKLENYNIPDANRVVAAVERTLKFG